MRSAKTAVHASVKGGTQIQGVVGLCLAAEGTDSDLAVPGINILAQISLQWSRRLDVGSVPRRRLLRKTSGISFVELGAPINGRLV